MSGAKLAGPQRAASVIVAIGIENASEIYKYLKEDEVEQLTFEITRLDQLAARDVKNTLGNFYQVCLIQRVIAGGSVEYARNVLEKTYDPQMASSLLKRVTRNLGTKVFGFIRKADHKNIITIIQNEHPQTIAPILSYTSVGQAASVIGGLPKNVRLEVVERIATIDRTSPKIIKIVEQNLERKFSSLMSLDFTEIGGVNYIADIMNDIDRTNEKCIFDELTRKDTALCEEVRKRMFVFEDITTLDDISIQRFLYEVDSKDLVSALKGANKEVAETIFKSTPARSSESVHSDLEYTHNVRLCDVEEVQQRIIGIIHRLKSEDELVIVKGGKDEFIA